MRRFLSGLLNGTVALGLIGVGMMLANKPASYLDLGSSYFDPFPRGAMAAQGSLCMPTTGTVSGLTFSQNVNTALAALVTSNSGTVSPTNDCSGLAVKGQQWLDTSVTPNLMKAYDGAQWLTIAAFDATGHTWQPRAGDGTLAAPGIAFQSELATGFRRAGTNDVRLTIAGVDVVQWNAAGMTLLAGTFNSVPVGSVMDYCGATEPAGWLFAYGQTLDRTTYAPLFAAYGTNFGAPSGSTFSAPDLRGRAFAGRDNMGGTAALRITSAYFGGNGNTLGAVGGQEWRNISIANLPGHDHSLLGAAATGVDSPGHVHAVGNNNIGHTHAGPTDANTATHEHTTTFVTVGLPTGTYSGTDVLVDDGVARSVQTGTQSANHTHTFTTQTDSTNHNHGNTNSPAASHAHGLQTVGSGTAHATIQPTIVCNKIMKI